MTRRDDESSLEGLEHSLRSRVDDALEKERPVSDFDAMMARARELDDSVSEMRDGPDEGPSRAAEAVVNDEQARRDEALLAPLVSALRSRTDRDIERRKAAGPWPAPARPTRLHATWAASIAVVIAASVLLVVDLDWVRDGQHSRTDRHSIQAQDAAELAEWAGGAAISRRGGVARDADEPQRTGDDVADTTGSTADAAGDSTAEDPQLAEGLAPWRPSRVDLGRRLTTLDRRGQAQWRAGQLRAAESTFWRIVKVGGRDPRVEMAFAELFALVRQRSGNMNRVWTRYLRRFPRGRYAGDAKAGLCRRATGQARTRCWEQYRSRFPDGIHRPDTLP